MKTFEEFLDQVKQDLVKENKFITRKGIEKLREVYDSCILINNEHHITKLGKIKLKEIYGYDTEQDIAKVKESIEKTLKQLEEADIE